MSDDQPRGLSDEELTRKDTNYSPGSDRETQELQGDPDESPATDDVDRARVGNLPGTGGPDDTGDVVPPDEELDEPL
ncbi:hypothetical protein GCM10022286_27540 [Gryllotalpicola daejeonensis]|uniref:Sugar ABC transporter ATPase n=1 Tax=Gryllotalpicola daejeonensis TaxID=993087 RepID=A0ABP7ZMT3_9MICO